MHRRLLLLALLSLCFIFSGTLAAQSALTLPAGGHPRLWITAETLPVARANATDANPIWVQIRAMAEDAAANMDSGALERGDMGSYAYEEYPVESSALLFAFVSLVHPDEAARADYAARARTLLMRVIDPAALGASDAPYRQPDFSISDRSRWYGTGFPLTVDWIYPTLSAEDKAKIAGVFTRWCDENRNAGTTNNNHPEPVGVTNDPVLLADRAYARWSNNNYYTAHMRNMGMMALSLDAADDTSGALAVCLNEAVGAWLYIVDDALHTDSAGGLGAEGLEYSPQTIGYTAQFLLALHTSGYSDPALYGQQVTFEGNPFWDDLVTSYAHSISPAPSENSDYGQVYLPAWYGSGQSYFMPDYIDAFGPLAVYDRETGNAARLNAMRWLQTYTAPGGEGDLVERVDFEQYTHAIFYYLMFDPADPAPTDPRPALATTFYAPGMRRLLARTDWTPDAEWLTYSLSWNSVDHQAANGNTFEFYRNGEWLTQVRVGYDLDYIASDNLNTLLIGNTPPSYDDWRYMLYERGSQWLYVADGDPAPPIITQGNGYISAYGDATPLYNSTYVGSVDVVRAARSLVWLQPDILVVYDQAATSQPSFKRFALNLPAAATTEGSVTTMTSPGGQQFTIYSLLPAETTLAVNALADEPSSAPAHFQTMTHRYIAEAVGSPTETAFLHVLVGSDAGTVLPTIELVSSDPAAPSVRVGDVVVSFSGETITVGQ